MTTQRLDIPPTAFSMPGKKEPARKRDEKHLRFIRSLHCVICGAPWPEAAHLRSSNLTIGNDPAGMQQKSSDKWTVPLCNKHHAEQHRNNEMKWWARQGMDPFGLALSLHENSGDNEAAERILNEHRKDRR